MPMGPSKTRAIDHLHRGQSNDCYWHGLFGGIYISHMRLATYEHLIAAEDAADHALGTHAPRPSCATSTSTGCPRCCSTDEGQVVAVKPGEGGGIGSWDIRAARHALAAALRRRPEAYHETLRAHEAAGATSPPEVDGVSHADVDDPRGRRSAARRLDPRPRDGQGGRPLGAAVLRRPRAALGAGAVPRAGRDARGVRDGRGERAGRPAGRRVRRRPPRPRPGLAVAQRHGRSASRSRSARRSASLGDRLGPGARHRHRAAPPRRRADRRRGWASSCRSTSSVAAATRRPGTTSAATDRPTTGAGRPRASTRSATATTGWASRSRPRSTPAADAWWSPIETVSNSESGFERVYQGSSLLLSWPLRLAPGEARRFSVRQAVSVARDRAAEEAQAPA